MSVTNQSVIAGFDGSVDRVTTDGETYLWAYDRVNDRDQRFRPDQLSAAMAFAGIRLHERPDNYGETLMDHLATQAFESVDALIDAGF